MEKPVQAQTNQTHVLFDLSPLDAREDIDDKTQKTYQNLKQMIANKTVKECHEIYTKHIAANPSQHTEDLTMGLLVAILVEQDGQQSKYYRDIVSFNKDGLNLFGMYLNLIITERLTKLRDNCVKQVFWIIHQLMKANVSSGENICCSIIRQQAGGDLSARNLRCIENLLELLIENRSWLINSHNFMVPTTIYTFMRLIIDHMGPSQATLRQKEIEFVVGLIKEKFLECLSIGRDFLRLLHNLTKIPEFEKLWHDIHTNPRSLHPTFQGPIQILATKTPRRLFQSRLTFEMEKKISFLATAVKFGNQKRYQDWFHKQYLSTPESLSLRCDLIRYICTIIHPSNEVLCSDIIPRWAIIGWLLTTCTTSASATSSKLALFFDWLLYDAKSDNIMNIEPAILVMYYSMRSHPNVTASLLEFLCRLPAIFSQRLSEHIKTGVKKSLQQILEKRVVGSIAPLFDNPKQDPALRALIKDAFPEFCHADNGIIHPITLPLPQKPIAPHMNAIPSQQVNHLNLVQNHVGAKKESEVIVIDQEKNSAAADVINTVISCETVGNKVLPNQETNHITNRVTDQPSSVSHEAKSVPQVCPPLSHPSSAPTSSSTTRDETKAFSWNGTENANASYSHKQNHDNKIRKSSMSNSGIIDPVKRNNQGVVHVIEVKESQDNSLKNQLTTIPTNTAALSLETCDEAESPPIKVVYPFMRVHGANFKETLNLFDDPVRSILEDLSVERCAETRCTLMDKLISVALENTIEQSSNSLNLEELGRCIASIVVDDISTRIFPSSSHDNESLEESLASPIFVVCRNTFYSNRKLSLSPKPLSLLVAISKSLDATGMLVLYFLKVMAILNGLPGGVHGCYIEFCNSTKRKLTEGLYEDLSNAHNYDSEMFCFLLPTVFGELVNSGSFPMTGNIPLIHMVVSTVDPISLQELICLCLTNTAKIIQKEDIMTLIETSLNWESWEQYCLWKLITAQGVLIETYISILPKLDTKKNAEAMSSILLNLQKISEPTLNILQQVINCECNPNDPFISSILRFWSMRTDVKEFAKMICTLSDSRPSSPQVKRKGQTKTKSSSSLGPRSEKILNHLEAIRRKAPKSKLLCQKEIVELITQLESLCNDDQKKRFSDLFANRPKPIKKQKRMDEEVTA